MMSKVSFGSLLDLFFTVDEFEARDHFGEQFRAVKPPPVFLASKPSLKTIVSVAIRESEPMVRLVRSRTVAKVDSMGLVVRKWARCWAGTAHRVRIGHRGAVGAMAGKDFMSFEQAFRIEHEPDEDMLPFRVRDGSLLPRLQRVSIAP